MGKVSFDISMSLEGDVAEEIKKLKHAPGKSLLQYGIGRQISQRKAFYKNPHFQCKFKGCKQIVHQFSAKDATRMSHPHPHHRPQHHPLPLRPVRLS